MMLTHDWITRLFAWHSVDVVRAVASPQQLPRLQTPRSYLYWYIDFINVYIPLVPLERVFNLDETGLSDSEERRPKLVLATADTAH
jgi:hypothetical protein